MGVGAGIGVGGREAPRRIHRARFSTLSPSDVHAPSALRTDVFYLEQSCSAPEMDWRDLEDAAEHYFMRDGV